MNKGTVAFRSLSLIGIVIAFLVAGPGLAQGSVSVGHASAVEAVQTIGPNHSTATPTYRSVVKPLSGWGMEPPLITWCIMLRSGAITGRVHKTV